ncbi:DNA repair protein RecN [Lactobacillus sp. 3B(2020)]|uniref:DNA repair protein RecN n=1 Tax=Lactobacillus sp. 3B(2020) TaxID=2695882 RepID=UPI0015DD8315|nr:DNA repair protein RecN [Lactobacillus sp. 3B(2020)]QLL70205.1 DNA repair protein RecN [Lactobacillus sp. 3B(2020)]
MLQELTIDNLAIINHLNLTFDDQMTVLTGETGAGKSIIIDAVGLLAGSRGSTDFIRQGAGKLTLQGQFTVPKNEDYLALLDEYGIDHEDGVLIISREIHQNGRNIIRVNGTLINTTTLRKLGAGLVDIQGQNEHQLLLQPEHHLGMLDQFAGAPIQPILKKYQATFHEYQQLSSAIEKKKENEQQWAQRLDMLRYQVDEIEGANLKPDEEEQLETERDRLEHFQQINNALNMVVASLNGEEGAPVLDQVAEMKTSVEDISDFDPAFKDLAKGLGDAYYSLQDAAESASRVLDSLEFDPARLDQIENRLTLIGDLEHKYGDRLPDVLAYYDQIKKELEEMEQVANDDSDQEERLAETVTELKQLGKQLTELRKQAAQKLENQVHQQLRELYMERAVFAVHFVESAGDRFRADGLDEVEFYMQTNPGERMGALAKIASGGELSRVMLALKTIFAKNEGVTSIIFDEVDTGVSGRVAQAIADKIKVIAQSSQVLCISHLPQVAAVAQHHFLIQKQVKNNRTTTSVTPLDESKRINEIARMLAGEKITKLTREHAKELLSMEQAN